MEGVDKVEGGRQEEEVKEKDPSMAEQTQAARYELLQELRALRTSTRNLRLATDVDKQQLLRLEDMCCRVENHVLENDAAAIERTPPSPPSQENVAECETVAGELLIMAGATGTNGLGGCALACRRGCLVPFSVGLACMVNTRKHSA